MKMPLSNSIFTNIIILIFKEQWFIFYSPGPLIVLNLILDENCAELVAQLFAEELIPVAVKAQKKVPIPEG